MLALCFWQLFTLIFLELISCREMKGTRVNPTKSRRSMSLMLIGNNALAPLTTAAARELPLAISVSWTPVGKDFLDGYLDRARRNRRAETHSASSSSHLPNAPRAN